VEVLEEDLRTLNGAVDEEVASLETADAVLLAADVDLQATDDALLAADVDLRATDADLTEMIATLEARVLALEGPA